MRTCESESVHNVDIKGVHKLNKRSKLIPSESEGERMDATNKHTKSVICKTPFLNFSLSCTRHFNVDDDNVMFLIKMFNDSGSEKINGQVFFVSLFFPRQER